MPLAILVDLAGPKIRLGDLPNEGTVLQKGQDIILIAKSDHQLKAQRIGGYPAG